MKPLMLYIHIPFCQKKCDYCDFLSGPSTPQQRQDYVDTLCKEISLHRNRGEESKITSIFFGGGTPSILTPDQITQIMDTIRTNFLYIEEQAEVSLELNPGTADIEKLRTYKKLGINRLSIGLQATNNQELKNLGRIHTYEDFLQTYNMARNLGFTNINVDLMSAIPGQSLKSWGDTLDKIVTLGPEHISAYSLIVEEGTPYHKEYNEEGHKHHLLPSEDHEREMYHDTLKTLQKADYELYEISNYAISGKECKHNLGYWERTPYLGLGLGAASLIRDEGRSDVRWKNLTTYTPYKKMVDVGQLPIEDRDELSLTTSIEEFIFLGLRKVKGISTTEYIRLFNESIEDRYSTVLKEMERKGLLMVKKDHIKLTEKGRDLSNYVLSEFL